MKYNVKFSCGHVQEKELFGKSEEREKKIDILKNMVFAMNVT